MNSLSDRVDCFDYRMLEDFDREIEHTDSRMRSLTSRVNKAIKQSGSKFTLPLVAFC